MYKKYKERKMLNTARTAHRNALGNAKNAFQTDAKKVLTVCSAGMLRSPTAANVLNREYGYNTRAVGMMPEYALVPMSEVLIYWADELVFMENWHLEKFQTDFDYFGPASSKLETGQYQVLNIPDDFDWMHEELQKHILNIYNPDVV
jgi:predicted protein tyrosine phosphatase